MLNQVNKYLLSVSGGVDSVVLFYMLLEQNINFDVIHFNHNTRGNENTLEEELVRNMCKENDIKDHVFDFNYNSGNFQSKAREFRQEVSKKVINDNNLSGLILAHHLDDQVENILMNDKKIGLKVMKQKSILNDLIIYRPLLEYEKQELIDIADKNNYSYYNDSSNNNLKYKRNYFRTLNNFSKEEKILMVKKELEKLETINKYNDMNLNNLKDVENKELFLYVMLKKYINYNVKSNLISDIIKRINFIGSKKFDLPNNYVLIQEYDKLSIIRNYKEEKEDIKKINKGFVVFNGIRFYNNLDNVFVRSRTSGDTINVNGHNKKVTRYMIDKKISKYKRDIWPIIIDDTNRIIYIPNKEM